MNEQGAREHSGFSWAHPKKKLLLGSLLVPKSHVFRAPKPAENRLPFCIDFNIKMDPKSQQQIYKKLVNFVIVFCLRFWSSAGAFWQLSWAFRGCLGRPQTPKTLKNCWFVKVFANAVFRLFSALSDPLGPTSASLRPIWFQNGSPKWPQKSSKKCSKTSPKNDPQNNQKQTIWGPKMDSKIS